MKTYRFMLAGLFAVSLAIQAQPAAAQFYKGKTLTLLVNYGVGGNADQAARLLQRHIARHIPGNPNVVVQNLPGGGGYKAMNILGLNVNRRPDGLTAGYFGLNPPGLIVRDPGLQVKMSDFAMVGGIKEFAVAIVRKDAAPGISKPADLAKAKQIFAGGYGRTNSNDAKSSLALEVLKVPYKMVTGFQGTADLTKALLQNEINFMTSSVPAFRRLVIPQVINSGVGLTSFYYPVANANGEPMDIPVFERMGIPSFPKVYSEAYGKSPSGPVFESLLLLSDLGSNTHGAVMLPKDAPVEAVAALRDGFNKLQSDPAFLAEYEKANGETPDLVTAEELAPILERIENIRPEVKQVVKENTGL